MRLRTIRERLPSRQRILGQPGVRHIARYLGDSRLWSFDRRSVSRGLAGGLFWTFIPIPFQTVPASVTCIVLRCNLPIAAVVVWISNPMTWLPLYGAAYLVGAWILGQPLPSSADLNLSWVLDFIGAWILGHPIPTLPNIDSTWVIDQLAALGLGCLIFSIVSCVLGYILTNLIWRSRVLSRRERRNTQHHLRSSHNKKAP